MDFHEVSFIPPILCRSGRERRVQTSCRRHKPKSSWQLSGSACEQHTRALVGWRHVGSSDAFCGCLGHFKTLEKKLRVTLVTRHDSGRADVGKSFSVIWESESAEAPVSGVKAHGCVNILHCLRTKPGGSEVGGTDDVHCCAGCPADGDTVLFHSNRFTHLTCWTNINSQQTITLD